DAEVLQDEFEQSVEGERRVEHESRGGVVIEPAEKGSQQCGLAGADLAGQENEPDVVLHAVGKLSQGVAVAPGQIKKLRVRRRAEGLFAESVEVEVHRRYELPRESNHTNCSLPCATK